MATLVTPDGRTIARFARSKPERLTRKQVLARRQAAWLRDLEAGQAAWLIAELAGVSERSVWRGLAAARALREEIANADL